VVKVSLLLVLGLTFNNTGQEKTMAKLEDILKIKAYKKQLSPYRAQNTSGMPEFNAPEPSQPEQDPDNPEESGEVLPSMPADPSQPNPASVKSVLDPGTKSVLDPEVLKKRKKIRMVLDALKGSE
jgi:hypothetical protein